ncbi:MAG: 5-(carboxyamino)imidazole ribonucleotide mutase [Candidatus Zixiibacteriota bacterium]
MTKVLIVIGSKTDMEYAEKCLKQLQQFQIEGTIEVSSAHRHPDRTRELAEGAQTGGYALVIAMAGLAAALPGVVAAHTNLPVIGVPLPAAIGGIDSLLSIAQMPPGIPVATMGIGSPGATNAAILAARIIALVDPKTKSAVDRHRQSL